VRTIRISVKRKVWLECDGRSLLGEGRYLLLKHIDKTHSLKESAARLGISYKTAYNYLQRMQTTLGEPIIKGEKGGPSAGGSTRLLPLGHVLMRRYEAAR
jgi:molybdate transport system regulatory protein